MVNLVLFSSQEGRCFSEIENQLGSELTHNSTTGPVLILLLYCLARWPEEAEKIRKEMRNVDYNDMTALAALPHLTATINESLRLYPAGPTFGSRLTPPEGLNCDGVYIPGGVKVVAPRWSAGRRKILLLLYFGCFWALLT